MKNDTIVAISTPPGEGGIGIIRMSGEAAETILTQVFTPSGGWKHPLETHRLTYGTLLENGTALDECMAVLMRAPRSYTREDVAELHLHSGTYVLQQGVALCLKHGARLAEPGEFTKRAFLNGRIDLSRAEAVMNLISARGEQAHRMAMRDLQGGVAAFARKAADELYGIQAGLAACIDYPEEVSDEEGTADLAPRIRRLIQELKDAVNERGSRLLREGLYVTLAGLPNVGKSSLLNALLGEDRAIVTEIPGTTRDLIEGELSLNGIRILLKDTAGLRTTADPVERIGVQRTEKAIREADLILLLLDGTREPNEEEKERLALLGENSLIVISKSDLPGRLTRDQVKALRPDLPCITCSAKNPDTLAELKDFLKKQTEFNDRITLTQPRQEDAVRRAVRSLESALETLDVFTPDMTSTDLQAAQDALSELTGDRADENLLDAVFSRFCVGK